MEHKVFKFPAIRDRWSKFQKVPWVLGIAPVLMEVNNVREVRNEKGMTYLYISVSKLSKMQSKNYK